jgi:dTDP-4-dehydrorhamnose 3,5-epimerase
MARDRFYLGARTDAFSARAGDASIRLGGLHSLAVRRVSTTLEGPILLEPTVHVDERGLFLETYRHSTLADLGIADDLVQDNHSRSRKWIVRGMHFQPGVAKLVRCARGAIDVLVDLRRGSPTFGHWEDFRLDDSDHHQR